MKKYVHEFKCNPTILYGFQKLSICIIIVHQLIQSLVSVIAGIGGILGLCFGISMAGIAQSGIRAICNAISSSGQAAINSN